MLKEKLNRPPYGYFRVAACVPEVHVACPENNGVSIMDMIEALTNEHIDLIVFPELCVTGYTCADLFHNRLLLNEAMLVLRTMTHYTKPCHLPAFVVGAPIYHNGALYNCAVVFVDGEIVAVIPKTYIPNYNEFYEKRWFTAGHQECQEIELWSGQKVMFGTKQLVRINNVTVGFEICEDLWAPIPPSCHAALGGAQVIVNLSASDDLIGKYDYLRSLIAQQSARCICGYVYVGAGYGESSTDLVFDGKAIVAENGSILDANPRWQSKTQHVICDIDIEAIERDRMHNTTFADCARREGDNGYLIHSVACNTPNDRDAELGLYHPITSLPFVPSDKQRMAERCDEILNIQVAGLARRLDFIKCTKTIIGISGGLDSTLALLVAVRTYDRLGLDRKGIIGVTMPGFGTTTRTKSNATKLMEELGVTACEISINDAVKQHFADIGHDPEIKDVTYENSQARERTQILMDVANQENGIVLGTGDLSELALGWATYNGDHMSMYGVNAGVPKTLVKHLVRYCAEQDKACCSTLLDILDTPISPELIPCDKDGNITQKTEDLVGPYELHDFFLYYMLRFGFSPSRVYMLAKHAFAGTFDDATILKWQKTFYRRFFQQQFKRSCLPDGPKVGSVCLSPRGDWRMPSDATYSSWLTELEF